MAFSCAVRKSDSKPVAWARQRSRSSFRSVDTSRSRARASRSLSRSCSNIAIRLASSVPDRSRTRPWCTVGSCSGPFLGNALASSEGSIENVPSSFLMALKRPDFIALLSVDLLFDVTFAAWDKVRNAMNACCSVVHHFGRSMRNAERHHSASSVDGRSGSMPLINGCEGGGKPSPTGS